MVLLRIQLHMSLLSEPSSRRVVSLFLQTTDHFVLLPACRGRPATRKKATKKKQKKRGVMAPSVSADDSSIVAQLAMSELSIGGSPAASADPIIIEQRNLNADHEWKKLFGTSRVSAPPYLCIG